MMDDEYVIRHDAQIALTNGDAYGFSLDKYSIEIDTIAIYSAGQTNICYVRIRAKEFKDDAPTPPTNDAKM